MISFLFFSASFGFRSQSTSCWLPVYFTPRSTNMLVEQLQNFQWVMISCLSSTLGLTLIIMASWLVVIRCCHLSLLLQSLFSPWMRITLVLWLHLWLPSLTCRGGHDEILTDASSPLPSHSWFPWRILWILSLNKSFCGCLALHQRATPGFPLLSIHRPFSSVFWSEVAQSCPTSCDPMDDTPQVPVSMGYSRQ